MHNTLTFLFIYRCIPRKWPGNTVQVFKVVLWLVKSWVFKMLSFFVYLCLYFSCSKQILLLYMRKNPPSFFLFERKTSQTIWMWVILDNLTWCFPAAHICKQISAGMPWLQSRNPSFIPDVAEIIHFLPNLCKMQDPLIKPSLGFLPTPKPQVHTFWISLEELLSGVCPTCLILTSGQVMHVYEEEPILLFVVHSH